MDDLISIAEAARLRGVTPSAIRDLIERQRLDVEVVGGRRFVLRSQVLTFKPEVGGRGRKAAK